jgi:hypothetical protein
VFLGAGSVLFPGAACSPLAGRVPFSKESACSLVAAWEANAWRLLVDLPFVAVPCIAEKVSSWSWGCHLTQTTANKHCMGRPFINSWGTVLGHFFVAVRAERIPSFYSRHPHHCERYSYHI